jgi:hypothetical protein
MRVAICVLGMSVAHAQQLAPINAKVETRALAGSLAAALASAGGGAGPRWVGYVSPAIEGAGNSCCYSDGRSGCGLERGASFTGPGSRVVQLEGDRYTLVLFRYEGGRLQRIRAFSGGCQIDAGGLPFVVLTAVRASESVDVLSGYVTDEARELADGALHAIARTDDPSAERALERFVAPQQSERLRAKVPFWLAHRGRRGLDLLKRVASQDQSAKVREQVAFAYSVSREPEALAALIAMAKSDASTHSRGQALFWLAQKAGERAVAAITDAIRDDPETEVKKKAVFALSQLPADQGVPRLIEVARTNRNPEVRKQAMFWLGQSKDRRAVEFFESVLAK